jgi:Xaa-Pro aminopeptidase
LSWKKGLFLQLLRIRWVLVKRTGYFMSISQAEFARRRQQLLADLPGEGAVILASAPPLAEYSNQQFSQDTHFYYLTGWPEPEALLLLLPGQPSDPILFCRDHDALAEQWQGKRIGLAGALGDYGVAQAIDIHELDSKIPELLAGIETIYYPRGHNSPLDRQLLNWLQALKAKRLQPPANLVDIKPYIEHLRRYKTPNEQAMLRQAARISSGAHRRLMQACQPGLYEYQLAAELHHEFLYQGSPGLAYPPIIAGGDNGCILHYCTNRCQLQEGDLVLVDAGCQWQGYCADITRTFPVNGVFNQQQQALYEVVLAAQLAAINAVQPGQPFNQPHLEAIKVLVQGLVDLGLLQGEPEALIEQEAYKRFFMHGTSHWLGLDVHDPGHYKKDGQWLTLEPGMVLTVEPGLYVAPDCQQVAEKWRGMGIRIEDDILVTPTGYEVLSHEAPKSVTEIQQLMAKTC